MIDIPSIENETQPVNTPEAKNVLLSHLPENLSFSYENKIGLSQVALFFSPKGAKSSISDVTQENIQKALKTKKPDDAVLMALGQASFISVLLSQKT